MNKEKFSDLLKGQQKVDISTAKNGKQAFKSAPSSDNQPQEKLPLLFAKTKLKKESKEHVMVRVKRIERIGKQTKVPAGVPQKKLPLLFSRRDYAYCPRCGAEHNDHAKFCSLCHLNFAFAIPKSLTEQEIIRSQVIEARKILKEKRNQSFAN